MVSEITLILQGNAVMAAVMWLLWSVVFLRLVAAVFAWASEYFVCTNLRLLLISGSAFSRKTESMILTGVNDVSLERSLWGSLLKYGTFTFESTDKDAVIEYVPYPEKIHNNILQSLFADRAEEIDH